MARYGLVIDVERCTGCYSCYLACKDEHVGIDHLPIAAAGPATGHNWMPVREVEHGSGCKVKVDYVPVPCQQCADGACMKGEFAEIVYRRADGIVVIDPVKAKGRKDLVDLCPYGAIHWNAEAEIAQKCTLCAHMLDNGEKTTRCAEACPVEAIVFGDLDDPDSAISRVAAERGGVVEALDPEHGTGPTVGYMGLPKPFVAGEVVLSDKPGDCAQGVVVMLQAAGEAEPLTTSTDIFGDFEFKGLVAGNLYTLTAESEGYDPVRLDVRLDASANVGELVLAAR